MKNKFEGIGSLGATLAYTALAASPASFLTNGILGKITYWLLEHLCIYLADQGFILLNVGIAQMQTLSQQKDFDGTIEAAIREVTEKKERLTADEKRAIDDKVISSFTTFAHFGSVRELRDSKP